MKCPLFAGTFPRQERIKSSGQVYEMSRHGIGFEILYNLIYLKYRQNSAD